MGKRVGAGQRKKTAKEKKGLAAEENADEGARQRRRRQAPTLAFYVHAYMCIYLCVYTCAFAVWIDVGSVRGVYRRGVGGRSVVFPWCFVGGNGAGHAAARRDAVMVAFRPDTARIAPRRAFSPIIFPRRFFSPPFTFAFLVQRWRCRRTLGLSSIGGPAAGLEVIVTGPTAGIGLQTALELLRRGAHVTLACRSPVRGEAVVAAAVEEARRAGRPPPFARVWRLDVSRPASVRAFSRAWKKEGKRLDVLINNAGVLHVAKLYERFESRDGIEEHLATNHLGPFLLSLLLLEDPKHQAALWNEAAEEEDEDAASQGSGGRVSKKGAASPSAPDSPPDFPPFPTSSSSSSALPAPSAPFRARVVFVNSRMHRLGEVRTRDPNMRAGYDAFGAYCQSKLLQLLAARELARRLATAGGKGGSSGADVSGPAAPPLVLAVHPGEVRTDVVRTLPAPLRKLYNVALRSILLEPPEGARSTLRAATDPSLVPAPGEATYLDSDAEPHGDSEASRDPELQLWAWNWSCKALGVDPEALPNPRGASKDE